MHDPNALNRLAAIAESEANCAEMSGMRAQALRRSNLSSLAECLRALAAQSATPVWMPLHPVPFGENTVRLLCVDADTGTYGRIFAAVPDMHREELRWLIAIGSDFIPLKEAWWRPTGWLPLGDPVFQAVSPRPVDDPLRRPLMLALEYFEHRQQRYKNRLPAWVQEARQALALTPPETQESRDET